ncbi:unnamed protein product [Chrysoparadoxa australica]
MKAYAIALALLGLGQFLADSDAFPQPMVMMGGRSKGGLARGLGEGKGKGKKGKGGGQRAWSLVSGVTLPAKEGEMKAWELDLGWEEAGPTKLAAIKHQGSYYAMESACTKCAWDLWKGDVLPADGKDSARVACPLCGTTYKLANGAPGEPIKRSGLAGWVGGLAQQSTNFQQATTAKTFPVRVDTDPDGTEKIFLSLPAKKRQ